MNIFFLAYDPATCVAQYLNKHLIKMILETAQLLCTAVWELDPDAAREIEGIYRPTHRNHPSAIWARASKVNWTWLRDLGLAMNREYSRRYSKGGVVKSHKSAEVIRQLVCPLDDETPFTAPPKCMPDQYKVGGSDTISTIQSYRNYIRLGKADIHDWKGATRPSWIDDPDEEVSVDMLLPSFDAIADEPEESVRMSFSGHRLDLLTVLLHLRVLTDFDDV